MISQAVAVLPAPVYIVAALGWYGQCFFAKSLPSGNCMQAEAVARQ
jgi:hypothetical protein